MCEGVCLSQTPVFLAASCFHLFQMPQAEGTSGVPGVAPPPPCHALRSREKPRCGSPDRPAGGGGPNSRRVADPSAAVSCSSERCTRPRTDNGLGDTADPARGQDPRGALGGRSPWSSPSPDAQRHGARGGRRAAVPPRQPVFRFCFLPPGRAWRRGAPWPGRVTGKRRECGGLAGPVGGGEQGRAPRCGGRGAPWRVPGIGHGASPARRMAPSCGHPRKPWPRRPR